MTSSWRRSAAVGLAAMAAGASALLLPSRAAPIEKATAQVTVALDRPGRIIPPGVFGTNLQWEYNGDLILGPGDPKGGWFPEGIIQAIRESGARVLRFPGGSLSDTYRWKAGIGPRASREPGLSFGGKRIPSNFGTDEFIRLCRETGVAPLLTVNFSVAPEEAGDWVEYMNGDRATPWGARRAANGSPEPLRTGYWEIGNELYSPGEPGHVDATAYAEKFLRFARELRRRDPKVKLGATLDVAFLQAAWMPKVMPHMATWNEEVLKGAGSEVDFAAVHWYAPFDKFWGDQDTSRLIWASPEVLGENLARIRDLLRKHARPGAEIALTEYGTAFNDKGRLDPRIAGTETALHQALLILQLLPEPGVALANNWSLLNNGVFGMLESASTGTLQRRPAWEVFRLLSRFAGLRSLDLDVQGDAYAVKAIGNIPARPRVPLVKGAAAGDGERRLVALVNRAPDRAVAVSLVFTGGPGPRALDGHLLTPPDGARHPAPAWSATRRLALQAGRDGVFHLDLPPQSLVVLGATGR